MYNAKRDSLKLGKKSLILRRKSLKIICPCGKSLLLEKKSYNKIWNSRNIHFRPKCEQIKNTILVQVDTLINPYKI